MGDHEIDNNIMGKSITASSKGGDTDDRLLDIGNLAGLTNVMVKLG